MALSIDAARKDGGLKTLCRPQTPVHCRQLYTSVENNTHTTCFKDILLVTWLAPVGCDMVGQMT